MKDFWESGDVSHAHNVECAFYEAISGVEGFPLPKVWFTRRTNKDGPGVILMEDLGAVGCKTGFMQAMTAQQVTVKKSERKQQATFAGWIKDKSTDLRNLCTFTVSQ